MNLPLARDVRPAKSQCAAPAGSTVALGKGVEVTGWEAAGEVLVAVLAARCCASASAAFAFAASETCMLFRTLVAPLAFAIRVIAPLC
jgi:hypothetical protein